MHVGGELSAQNSTHTKNPSNSQAAGWELSAQTQPTKNPSSSQALMLIDCAIFPLPNTTSDASHVYHTALYVLLVCSVVGILYHMIL